jgi:predicted transcriptional regulator
MATYSVHVNTKPMTARLAEVLNRQLRESNLSVSETSRKTGIPYPTLYRRLHHAGHGLTIDETERLAGALNTTPVDLLNQAK